MAKTSKFTLNPTPTKGTVPVLQNSFRIQWVPLLRLCSWHSGSTGSPQDHAKFRPPSGLKPQSCPGNQMSFNKFSMKFRVPTSSFSRRFTVVFNGRARNQVRKHGTLYRTTLPVKRANAMTKSPHISTVHRPLPATHKYRPAIPDCSFHVELPLQCVSSFHLLKFHLLKTNYCSPP